MAGQIDACFPTTTTVNLATIATGLSPSRHGIFGYQLYLPDAGDSGEVANTIKWTTLWGDPLAIDTAALLPRPNLWERLVAAGIEPVTVQPAHFGGSPLSLMLYRGCRFEGVTTYDDLVDASVDLASTPGRLVLAYLPEVDYAAHVHGQASPEYAAAIGLVDTDVEPDGEPDPAGGDHGGYRRPRPRRRGPGPVRSGSGESTTTAGCSPVTPG